MECLGAGPTRDAWRVHRAVDLSQPTHEALLPKHHHDAVVSDAPFWRTELPEFLVQEDHLTCRDVKRARWLRQHRPRDGLNASERVAMVSRSQSPPCKGAGGNNLLLCFLKNKVDYCRLHAGVQLFYNTALLQPEMRAYWAKILVVRAAMLAHPEA